MNIQDSVILITGAFAVAMDVTDEASINTALKSTQDVTALINNAGVLSFGDVFSSPLQQWQQTFDVNTYGTLRLTQKFSPVIEQNGGGQIINILTLLSLASMPGMAAYNASKAAAWSINLSLRASLAGKGIAIYGVFPGAIDTDMLAEVDMPKTSPSDVAQAVVNGVIEGNEDIFPDPMSKDVYAAWTQDHKAVEKQFAQM